MCSMKFVRLGEISAVLCDENGVNAPVRGEAVIPGTKSKINSDGEAVEIPIARWEDAELSWMG
jgi:hypothetical protein